MKLLSCQLHSAMATLSFLALVAFAPLAAHAQPDRPLELEGEVSRVTLYRGQALVTRTIALPARQTGSFEVVIGNLPEQIMPQSLFSEPDDSIEVRAVRYRQRAVNEQPREEVQALQEAIREATHEQQRIAAKQTYLNQRSAYLDQLAQFVAPTATTELSHGVLDSEELQRMVLFSFEQRAEISEQTLELSFQREALQEKIHLLQRQLAELTTSNSRTVREAVLFVEKPAAGQSELRLSYLVAGCGWQPTYSVRASSTETTAQVEYSALIQQMSGENWENVELTLSTASPSLSSTTPGLAPFHVTLTPGHSTSPLYRDQEEGLGNDPSLEARADDDALASQLRDLNSRQQQAQYAYGQGAGWGNEEGALNWNLNRTADELQTFEICRGRVVAEVIEESTEPALSYKLDNRISLASRSDQQIVRILQTGLPSTLYHIAIPVLTDYIHRETELVNNSAHDLLSGQITVYLDGRFVGRSTIPTVTRGQKFTVGLGADSQLRAHRELVTREERLQGGNREWVYQYRIEIENYTDQPVAIRLLDRTPYSQDEDSIRLTLGEMSRPLSEDPRYVRTEQPKGLLRWDIEVPAESSSEEAFVVEYGYSVEFDRNYHLTSPGGNDEGIRREFERLQRGRMSY